jgi:AcrR family transcriptional regulator
MAIQTAWGLRERPAKGPKPGLTLDSIVVTGVQVVEAEGLAAVSMSRVAKQLGTAPASLYRHLAAKDELLALIADAVLGPPPSLKPGWRVGLEQWAWEQHAIFHARPWILKLPVAEPPTTPNQIGGWNPAWRRCARRASLERRGCPRSCSSAGSCAARRLW